MPGLDELKALVCWPALSRVPVCMIDFEHAKAPKLAQAELCILLIKMLVVQVWHMSVLDHTACIMLV